ncbi:MAG TPA: alpha/beta fold hydrolase [Kineosporiaceae bacterium]
MQLDESVNLDEVERSSAFAAFSVHLGSPTGPVRVHVWPAADGASGRPVLLCLHAATDSGEAFGPLAAALGRRWTVVAPDAPGHGGTLWPPGPHHRIADHALTALAVLDRLPSMAGRRAPVVLLGHAMGALTAARLAAARPRVVTHLMLEEPARAGSGRPPTAAALRAEIARRQALGHDGLLAEIRAEAPGWPPDEQQAWARSSGEASLDAFRVRVDWGEPLVALLADVQAPVTLVHGARARGGTVPGSAARRCAAACRSGCEIVPLDCGPQPRREAREPFIAVLASVLGRTER